MRKRTKVVIFGGSGYVGRNLAASLPADDYEVVIPSRHRDTAKRDLIVLPNVSIVNIDFNNFSQLEHVLADADVLVNLVGILNQSRSQSYVQVGENFISRVLDLCDGSKVNHIVQMSALGATASGMSEYLKSKYQVERLVHEHRINSTCVRSSVIYGSEDNFVRKIQFLASIPSMGLMYVPMSQAQLQPIYIENVIEVLLAVICKKQFVNKTISIAGPKVHAFGDLAMMILLAAGCPKKILRSRDFIDALIAWGCEIMPFCRMISRDNIASMKLASELRQEDNMAAQLLPNLIGFTEGLERIFTTKNHSTDHLTKLRSYAGRNLSE